jgi:PAS domain S-box-containing protein
MTGYSDGELRQINPAELSVSGDRDIYAALFWELRQGKRQHFEMVKRLQRKDGTLIWIQLYGFAIRTREPVCGPHWK